jgi:hypothetical protein
MALVGFSAVVAIASIQIYYGIEGSIGKGHQSPVGCA